MSNGTWTRWVISGVRTLLLIHHANALLHRDDEMWDEMGKRRKKKQRVSRQRRYGAGRLKGVLAAEHVVTNLRVLYTTDFMV